MSGPSNVPSILLLAGTAEARALSDKIAQAGWSCRIMMANPPRVPGLWPEVAEMAQHWAVPPRPEQLKNLSAVVDARHPFDQAEKLGVEAVAQAQAVPFLRLRRVPWRPGPRDKWIRISKDSQLRHVLPRGMRLLTATGRDGLRAFGGLHDTYVFVRQLEEHDEPFPLARGRWLFDNAPFRVGQEIALMRKLRIDGIVVRNAGGQGAWPKLAAARHLGIPVVLIDPPRVPAQARTVDEAMIWLRQKLGV